MKTYKTIHEKHIEMIDAVNNSTTQEEHKKNIYILDGWRKGVNDCGKSLSLISCDHHYIDLDINRPMCGGVWIDWEEK